jgi:signal transduction histidine kinase
MSAAGTYVNTRRGVRGTRTRRPSLPVLTSIAEAVVIDLLSGQASAERVEGLVRETAKETGLPPNAAARDLFSLLIRDPALASADPAVALEAHLTALLRFAPIGHASLWLVGPAGELCATKVGERVHTRRLRATARQAVANGRSGAGRGSSLRALSVTRLDSSVGALVVQVKTGRIRLALDYAGEAVDFLSPIVERQLLLGQVLQSGGQLLETAERRIARFGFDIHDGPLQDISILAGELSAFQRELRSVVQDEQACRMVERRVAHVKGIVIELDRELRDLAIAAGRGSALPIGNVLKRETAHFERRTGIRSKLVLEGDLDRTTASQRIAVMRVVEEALANVREHSRATHARVSVQREAGAMRVCIADDGRGFDVGRAMRRAERDHRLGLVAMAERVRLLGGQIEIDSRPGGPTVISAVLPAWTPAG